MRGRFVVTGHGCVTAFGAGASTLFDGWLAGRSAVRPIRRFDTSGLGVHLGAEMPDPAEGDEPRGARHLRAALDEALRAASLPVGARIDVVAATTKGFLESGTQVEGRRPEHDVGLPARFAAEELRARHGCVPRRVITVSTACASGLAAVATATWTRADVDAVVCVGVDLLSDFVYRGFAALAAMDAAPCRPFDVDRRGMSPGEAAAVVVLEPGDRAAARGATIRGRLLGAGLANDAEHPTAPSRDGGGMARAMAAALRDLGVAPERLGHVQAHGTATVFNDAMELRALATTFGRSSPPVTALKGAVGHAFGAAGLVELIASLEAVRAGRLPAVTGLVRPEGDLDLVREPRALASPVFLKTSAGFGGFDAALVVEGVTP